ncbi:BTB POZ domain-containing POB1, partial [Paramuricea clavata]
NQQIGNKLSNEGKDDRIATTNHENETTPFDDEESTEIQGANEIEVTNKYETMLNENVEINQHTGNGNKMKDQHESETANDASDPYPSLNDKEQSGHSKDISSDSNEATSYSSNEGQIIRQHKFYVHGVWLAVQSPYFRSLFDSGTKDSSAPEVHVQISESEEQTHLMLLEAMYKIDTLDNASVDELLDVLRLAQKFDVQFVFKKCKYCLETMVDSVEICEKIIRFIKVDNAIADVEDLEKTLQSFLAKEFSPLDITWQTTRFTELCEHS